MIVTLKIGDQRKEITYDELERMLRDGQVPPDAMVHFDAVTGDRFLPISDLELYRDLVHSDQVALRRHLKRRGLPLVTLLLAGIQFRFYLWSRLPGARTWLMEHLANWGPAILERSEVYRLFTCSLIHDGLTHLAFNLLFLVYAGWNLEHAMGRVNLLLLYSVSIFSGGLLSLAANPGGMSIGASAGDFGLIAGSVVFGWKHGDLIPASARKYFGWAILPYLVLAFVSGMTSAQVDNVGHVGGLLAGASMATILQPRLLRRHHARNRRLQIWVSALLLVFLLSMAAAGQRLVPMESRTEAGIVTMTPAYWLDGWTFTGDRGSFSPTGLATLVVATTVHPQPLEIEEAIRQFLEQVDAGVKHARIVNSQPATLDGWPAASVDITLEISGEPYFMYAFLVCRGHYLHRVHMHIERAHAAHYDVLWNRIRQNIELKEPEELASARSAAISHPSSWRVHFKLGEALRRAGLPDEAMDAYMLALNEAPTRAQVLTGIATIIEEYGEEPGRRAEMRQALEIFRGSEEQRQEVLKNLPSPGFHAQKPVEP